VPGNQADGEDKMPDYDEPTKQLIAGTSFSTRLLIIDKYLKLLSEFPVTCRVLNIVHLLVKQQLKIGLLAQQTANLGVSCILVYPHNRCIDFFKNLFLHPFITYLSIKERSCQLLVRACVMDTLTP